MRPAVGVLSDCQIQLSERSRLASFGWDLNEARLGVDGGDDVAILAPTGATSGIGVAESDGLGTIDASLLQLSFREESNPLAVRGEEWSVGSLGSRQLRDFGLVQPAREKTWRFVPALEYKYDTGAVRRNDHG